MNGAPGRDPVPAWPAHLIGTAGHIDHGKSALVRALTGIDPDRLEEEKRRGMTIDLGFAHLDLPDGRRVGIVDVPGHERLIRNMLAGAGGMDLVLLLVAADEGVMPQTREHLDILRFLRPHAGLVVLSKIDLAIDAGWLALIEEDLRALTAGSFLEGAPILRASARTGEGLEALVRAIAQNLDALPDHAVDGPARLPVDRVFTMAGFGTVVTGTLWSGRIRTGDVLAVLPGGSTVRVRHVERHGERVEEVVAGSRAALNLAGVERASLARGAVLATLGSLRPSSLLDVQVRLLPNAPPQPHQARLRFYLGADEAFCRIALLDRDRLAPGEDVPAQLRFERPVVAARGDRFVLRRYSPPATLGGGVVVAVDPPRRRRGAASAETVAAFAGASPDAALREAVAARGLAGATAEGVAPELTESPTAISARLRRQATTGELIQVGDHFVAREVLDAAAQRLIRLLEETHRERPWRLGAPREEAKRRVLAGADDRLAGALWDRLIASCGVAITRGFAHLPGHRPQFAPEETRWREIIFSSVFRGRFTPPGLLEVEARAAGSEEAAHPRPAPKGLTVAVQSLQEEGALIEVAPGILFAAEVIEEVWRRVVTRIEEGGEITVGALRDALGTSRKYALALLEYFDGIRLTRRIGDRRVLGEQAAEERRSTPRASQ